jgi:hypothetical protein
MRKGINSKAVALTLVALMVGPVVALAEGEMTSSMASMEARLLALEDKLAASEATIAAQQHVLRAQQPAVSEGGLDDFLRSLEIGGHVSASYVYNFNNPDQNTGNVSDGPDHGVNQLYQFNTDHNTFSLDAAKIELGKSVNEPGDAGFQLDILFGDNAGVLRTTSSALGTTSDRAESSRDLADNSVFIDQAFVSYNFEGVELNMGKFYTWMGAEAMDSVENANVTHSLLFTWGIPLWHTGIRAGGEIGEGVSWGVGVVNGFNNVTDYGDNKGIIGLLGWEDEMMSLTGTVFVGSEGVRASTQPNAGMACATGGPDCVGDDTHDTWILDVVAKAAPTEQFQLWAEGNYGETDGDANIMGSPFGPMKANNGKWYGAQLGGQFDFMENAYVAVRGEYFRDDNGARLPNSSTFAFGNTTDQVEVKELTVTLGYNLAENLLARLEFRRDWWNARDNTTPFATTNRGAAPGVGTSLDTGGTTTQDVGIFEVSYIFD